MKMLCGKNILGVLMGFPDVLSVFIPEIAPTVGFDQKNPTHPYDLWEHTSRSIDAARPDPLIRLALLFHDLGKPKAFFAVEDGIGHFYRHDIYGEEIARERLGALKFDHNTKRAATELVLLHDADISEKGLVKWLNRLGEERLRQLFEVQKGDASAHGGPYRAKRLSQIEALERKLDELLREGKCFTLKDLAVNGTDILALGTEGPAVGRILDALLCGVMEGRIENERTGLLDEARDCLMKG
jgi:tRNA nucleotidyltransferase (CCA-adding enzyme)